MQNDARIPNLASKVKPDNICPFFWPKTVESWDFLGIFFSKKSQDSSFLPKGGSNVIQFELCGQIWNPLTILHSTGPHLM